MKPFAICVICCFGLFTNAFSQETERPAVCQMISRTWPRPDSDPSAKTGAKEASEKYKNALVIFEKLVATRGDVRIERPVFSMSQEAKSVALINTDQHPAEIALEEKAYDVCAGLGAEQGQAALAFLIGHQLTHYYQKHAVEGSLSDLLRKDFDADGRQFDADHETEADLLGGFLAYLAGYGQFDQGADLVKKLYEAYTLPARLPGYTSLAERRESSRRTTQKLEDLIHLFEMANLLTAVGSYAEAAEYYKRVLLDYQSREIYNNVGVMILLDAMGQFKENELKYHYPVELDLGASSSKGSSGAADARSVLLRQALLFFDASISMDPDYAPAFLNKACAYALLGDTLRAHFYAASEARRAVESGSSFPKTGVDIDVLLGIMAANAGDPEKAKKLFESAAATPYGALAAINLKILNGEPLDEEKPATPDLRKEKIDDQTTQSITNTDDGILKIDPDRTVQLPDGRVFFQNLNQGPGSYALISQNPITENTTLFHLTKPGYEGKTVRGIGLDDNRASIVGKYGEPKRTVETLTGQIMVYKNILFILSEDRLIRWANYVVDRS